jgi:hypothetical protein
MLGKSSTLSSENADGNGSAKLFVIFLPPG